MVGMVNVTLREKTDIIINKGFNGIHIYQGAECRLPLPGEIECVSELPDN